ncbi:MFS transporter [Thermoflavimicrobium dichotomicum]|uniref:MFS transporter, DHA1 family, multidrug resistance protein n=1 Tax=Thermoflavimicrobium dichotomicum TaxID=46223 RepID=A0A1I3MPP3_9BACL|nr:MFS transporter [Thermoflavimicrobium dichotomicum]SFI99084.1 MFS transporter, DHA1 family, multidrug resistance protein [Thermoflavimicrobium dichotomicum]
MKYWRRNLYILMICQFLVLASMSMIMPFLPLYLQEMGMKNQDEVQLWAGIIFGANFFSAFIFAPIWGNLADRFGRKIMVLRSGFGMAIVIFLTGLATSPTQLLFLRLLNGIISGFVPASISLMSTNSPKEKVGYALGMLQSGAVAGTIIGPFFGGILAEAIGYRMIFFITGIGIAIATFVVLFFVKEEFCLQKEKQKSNMLADATRIFRQKQLPLLFGVGFLMQFALMGAQPLMSLFVSELGAPGGYIAFFSGLVASVTGVANMISSPILGRLGDRHGSERVLFFAMIGTAVFFIPHMIVGSVWKLLIIRFLLGLFVGGLAASLNSLIRKYAPPGKISTVYGYNTSATCLGNMLGPICGGFFSGLIGIRGVFLLIAVTLFVAAILLKIGLRIKAIQHGSDSALRAG